MFIFGWIIHLNSKESELYLNNGVRKCHIARLHILTFAKPTWLLAKI